MYFLKFFIKYEIIFYKNQNSQKGAKAFIRLKKNFDFLKINSNFQAKKKLCFFIFYFSIESRKL